MFGGGGDAVGKRELPRGGAGRRGDRVVAGVCAVIGAVAGLAAFLCAAGSSPEPLVVQAAIIRSDRPAAGAELSVRFFGRPGFTKTSPDPQAFDLEALLWVAVPELTLVVVLASAGAYVGWKVGSRLSRSRRGGGQVAASEAADYDDRLAAEPGAAADPRRHTGPAG